MVGNFARTCLSGIAHVASMPQGFLVAQLSTALVVERRRPRISDHRLPGYTAAQPGNPQDKKMSIRIHTGLQADRCISNDTASTQERCAVPGSKTFSLLFLELLGFLLFLRRLGGFLLHHLLRVFVFALAHGARLLSAHGLGN
jgi:hypothetical protein